jgi:8-oxo-dGTP diphosphatase
LGGLWEFPGGKVDPGESPGVALARELKEELGIEVKVGNPLDPVEWNYDRGAIRLMPFFCTIESGCPRAIEHEQIRWCGPDEFAVLEWAGADLPILTQIRGF